MNDRRDARPGVRRVETRRLAVVARIAERADVGRADADERLLDAVLLDRALGAREPVARRDLGDAADLWERALTELGVRPDNIATPPGMVN